MLITGGQRWSGKLENQILNLIKVKAPAVFKCCYGAVR